MSTIYLGNSSGAAADSEFDGSSCCYVSCMVVIVFPWCPSGTVGMVVIILTVFTVVAVAVFFVLYW